MKILKVELQNINSLKSNSPIVIDFETNDFKDVGLYAITGATGAGKTTILDAITIALYHQVPRFKNSRDKSLENVVSYGANMAHSRITFENDHEIFEAFWGIRLATKKGVKIKNPKEEVSLKNLTTNTIITSNKKRDLIDAVLKVTQLDYTQFLRSVLLAQGEFASFLTAKGAEKGKLLEQITGEDIYKKIGFSISDRKIKEEKALYELESTINSDDVLTEDKKVELEGVKKIKHKLIKETEDKLKDVQFIIDWYKKNTKLKADELEVTTKKNKLTEFELNHKAQLDLLNLNEKAEPFKELVQNLNRAEKESRTKLNELEKISIELKQLLPKIESLETLDKSNITALEEFETVLKLWQPKFDEITKLDSEIKNVTTNTFESKKSLEKSIQTSDTIQVSFKANTDLKIKLTNDVEGLVKETTQQANLKLVDEQLSDWTKALTTLKHNKASIQEGVKFINEKQVLMDTTAAELNTKVASLEVEVKKNEDLELNLNKISDQLKTNDSKGLNAKKDSLIKKEQEWKSFQHYSELYLQSDTNLSQNKIDLNTVTVALEKSTQQILALTGQVEAQEVAVKDGEKILNLENSIKNYEADRAKLIPGDECGLCGSTEHPFVSGNRVANSTASEQELESRKTKLKSLRQTLNIELQTKAGLDTKKSGLLKAKTDSESQLTELTEKTKELALDCEVSNTSKIQIQLNLVKNERLTLDEAIALQNQLQAKKETLQLDTSKQKEVINTLKRSIATLTEKLKNNKEAQVNTQKTNEETNQKCNDLESDLRPKLSQFNYALPIVEQTDAFINDIKERIANYNLKLKDLERKKAELVVLDTKLSSDDAQLKEKLTVQNELQNVIKLNDESIKIATEKRQLILPNGVTVDEKRLSLQKQKQKLDDQLKYNRTELQAALNSRTKKDTLNDQMTSEQTKLKVEIETVTQKLNEQLLDSDFDSKQALESALLNTAEKEKFTKNKDYIKEESIKIETLRVEHVKDVEELNRSKNFKIAEADITEKLTKLTEEKDSYVSTLGEIKEAYRKDQEIRDRNKSVYVKIDAQNEIVKVWRQLYHVVGNSKEAFNIYVQRLTLKNLLKLANSHLYQLNKRYSLEMSDTYKSGEELNFFLIDHYQTDQSRLVDTSSGGEKFIISLALALGLSDLASKNVKIDSLFIDEGFGTLDNNTLETVISTLETLQSQGKKIGIISHVENLKERIPTQVQVTKKSNGVSSVEVVY